MKKGGTFLCYFYEGDYGYRSMCWGNTQVAEVTLAVHFLLQYFEVVLPSVLTTCALCVSTLQYLLMCYICQKWKSGYSYFKVESKE